MVHFPRMRAIRSSAKLVVPGLAVVGLLLCAACDRPAGRQPRVLETRLRFVDNDPQTILARGELVTAEQLFSWRSEPEDRCLEIWPSPRKRSKISLGGHQGQLEWKKDRVHVWLAVALDAAAVDRLDVVLKSLVPGSTRIGAIALLWTGRDGFSRERSLADNHGEATADGSRRFRFPVGTHGAWRGRVSRLSLRIQPPVGARFALCSIDGIAEQLRQEKLAELAASGFKAVLGGQIRNALPAIRGLPIERELKVPRAAELRFAYGLPAGVRVGAIFRVTALTEDEQTIELFRTTLTPDEGGGQWQEGRVDLLPLSGQRITLRLETSMDGDLDPKHGFPFWANPEVLAPQR